MKVVSAAGSSVRGSGFLVGFGSAWFVFRLEKRTTPEVCLNC